MAESMVGFDPHHAVQGQISAEGVPNVAPETAGLIIIIITRHSLVDWSAS